MHRLVVRSAIAQYAFYRALRSVLHHGSVSRACSMLVDCGAARVTVASTSSHFCSAERQFRLPLEYGGQRTPTSQRTATAAGASVVERRQSGKPAVDAVTIGRITDLGIKDANNMGAAMAPAAANTIADFLKDTSSSPSDFDMILTGDLGKVGSRLFVRASAKGSRNRYRERSRGLRIAPVRRRKAGCSRRRLRLRLRCSILNSYIMRRLESGELSRVLFVATGALMSPTSSLQGESIPSIAHAVLLSKPM